MTKDEIIKYWLISANIDFKAMNSLFKSGNYMWSLFIGHLVLEKLLKVYYVKRIDVNFPKIHNLLRIAEKSGIDKILSEEQKEFLILATTFNINDRYPEYKHEFYKKCSKSYTKTKIEKIKEMRKWLLKKIAISLK